MDYTVPEKLLKPRFQDYVLGAAIACASVAWLISPTEAGRGEASSARLSHAGEGLAELPLDRPSTRSYDLESGRITVEVVPGRGIHVSEANCPVKICRHSGWASRPGEGIVCLPNKLLIEVEGKDREYDAVIN